MFAIPGKRLYICYIFRVNNWVTLSEEVVIIVCHIHSRETLSSHFVVCHKGKPDCTASHTRPCFTNPTILTKNDTWVIDGKNEQTVYNRIVSLIESLMRRT